MLTKQLSILVVDHDRGDFDLIGGLLGQAARCHYSATAADALGRLRREHFDVLLVGYRLDQTTSTEMLRQLREAGVDTPAILLSGHEGELLGADAASAGASDCLVTTRLTPSALSRAVRYALERHHDAEALREMQQALHDAEDLHHALIENIGDSIAVIDREGNFTYANFSASLGYSSEVLVGTSAFSYVHPEDLGKVRGLWEDCIAEPGATVHTEIRVRHKNGSWRHLKTTAINRFERKSIAGVVASYHDVTERNLAQAALSETQERYRQVVENATHGIFCTTPEGEILDANPALLRMLGYASLEEIRTRSKYSIYVNPEDRSQLLQRFQEFDVVEGLQFAWKRKDGSHITVRLSGRLVCDPRGDVHHFDIFVEDITQYRRLEEQLHHAQKMDAVGRLAGGVAHDFNNILGIILGYSELLEDDAAMPDSSRRKLGEIKSAARRAVDLTRQLLAFSRKQVMEPRNLDLNSVVENLRTMLGRVLGANVRLVTELAPALALVKVDPAQIEQILMNLATNARDAMPGGGRLLISTSNAEVDRGHMSRHLGFIAGRYVVLAVADTGTGMDEATRNQVFEPFFTTKELHSGSGLGLSTVYGIVKQSGGYIWVYSEPGHGSTFNIYLPQVGETVTELPAAYPSVPHAHHATTVLLVEDDPLLRDLNEQLLANLGYTVLRAGNGTEALECAAGHDGAIHLLLTDVIMPGLNGRELAGKLLESRPGLKVLYVSGYAADVIDNALLQENVAFLQKPFSRQALARKIVEVMGPVQAAPQDAAPAPATAG